MTYILPNQEYHDSEINLRIGFDILWLKHNLVCKVELPIRRYSVRYLILGKLNKMCFRHFSSQSDTGWDADPGAEEWSGLKLTTVIVDSWKVGYHSLVGLQIGKSFMQSEDTTSP